MLRAVLPPMASISMQGEGTWSSDTSNILRQYAYLYRYDMRNRCISKRLPGSDWIRIVYDRTDAPIFTQNGAQRLRGEWAFAIPDIFGRTALSGICSNVLNAGSLAAVSVRAVPTNDEAEAFAGYDISGTILSSPHHVSAYYYDDYDFLALSEFSNKDLEYDDSGVDASFLTRYGSDAEGYKHTGLQTGSRMAIVSADPDMDSCLYVATYYDKKKRPIQSRNYGHHGKDHEYLVYTFTGQPSVSKHVYPGDWIVTTENDYDHAERLRETTIEVDGLSGSHAGTRIGYAYDELGRLASKTYGTGDSPLQIHYTHNMHGELVQQQSDRFCMSLAYESPLYVAPSYSGNIVEWTWQYGDGDENTYAFSYDNLSRLTNTKQYLDGTCVDRFVEQGIAYDRNGNMLSLDRSRGDGTGSDFSYMYEGNRLVSLVDSGENYSYTYDTNGNLIHDGANNLDITYNDLNQIEKVNRDGGVLANFSYLANGQKYMTSAANGSGLCYVGSLVYERSSSGQSLELESLGFDGGRFIKTTSGLEPRYFITDHLGSVRVVVNDQGEVLEQNDYYPFGLRWENAESPITDNRYRYNGKEEQSFVSVPYIDYGARMYDPKYGIRWTGVDPLSEKYLNLSPYAFCAGNPIKFVDPNGEDIWELDSYGHIVDHKEDDQIAFYMVEYINGTWQRTGVGLEFDLGTEISSKTYTYSPDEITVSSYDVYEVRGDDVGNTLFEFLSDNITGSPTKVEFAQFMTGIEGDKGLHFITTSHTQNRVASFKYLFNDQIRHGYTVREINHSHTWVSSPSPNDDIIAKQIINAYRKIGWNVPKFHIYNVKTRQKVPYGFQNR